MTPTLQNNIEEAKKRFRKDFVWNMTTDDHDVVAHYDEEDRDLEFWNAYKLEAFLEQELTSIYTLAQEEARKEMEAKYADIFAWLLGEKGDFPNLAEKPHYKFRTELRERLSTLSNNTLQ